jgi:hypothetical protein
VPLALTAFFSRPDLYAIKSHKARRMGIMDMVEAELSLQFSPRQRDESDGSFHVAKTLS